jgi:hypothetical protein
VSVLIAGATQAGSRVFSSRSEPITDEEKPALVVWTRRENARELGSAPLEYEEEVVTTIELFMKASASDDPIDDQVDDFAQEIKDVLFPNPTLNGKADRGRYRSTDYDQDPDGERITGAAVMAWSYFYHEDAIEDAAPSDLSAVHLEIETDDSENVDPEIKDDFAAP